MKITSLLLVLAPIFMFSQVRSNLLDRVGRATIKYEKNDEDSSDVGILGIDNKRSFVIFVKEKAEDNKELLFDKIIFETSNLGKKKAKLYLVIYENKDSLPGKLLESSKTMVNAPVGKKKIIVDLSTLQLIVPKAGYFVGFEWIISEDNKITGTPDISNLPYNPAVTAVINTLPNLFVLDQKWTPAKETLATSLNLQIHYFSVNDN